MIGPTLRSSQRLVDAVVDSNSFDELRIALLKAMIADIEREHHACEIAHDTNDYSAHQKMLESEIQKYRGLLASLQKEAT